MTDDAIHSSSYYIKYINRAILANLQCRTLKLGRLIVLLEIHLWLLKICSHGNSLFCSPHPLDFNMLVIFSLKMSNEAKNSSQHICLLYHAYEVLLANIRWNAKGARKAFAMGEVWNQVYCHGNSTVKLVLWSTLSRILLPRTKRF